MVFVDPMTSLHDANDLVQTCIYMNIYAYYVYAFFRFITWKQGDVVLAASLPGVGFIRNTPPHWNSLRYCQQMVWFFFLFQLNANENIKTLGIIFFCKYIIQRVKKEPVPLMLKQQRISKVAIPLFNWKVIKWTIYFLWLSVIQLYSNFNSPVYKTFCG